MSLEFVVEEGALEDATFLHENALAVPSVVEELSVVATSISVVSFSLTVGHVVLPEAFVLVA